jgi:hypothetical protein
LIRARPSVSYISFDSFVCRGRRAAIRGEPSRHSGATARGKLGWEESEKGDRQCSLGLACRDELERGEFD